MVGIPSWRAGVLGGFLGRVMCGRVGAIFSMSVACSVDSSVYALLAEARSAVRDLISGSVPFRNASCCLDSSGLRYVVSKSPVCRCDFGVQTF